MANEGRITAGWSIRKTVDGEVLMDERTSPSTALIDVDGLKGPVPGDVTVATTGTDIDLTQLTEPGPCWLLNRDPTNYVIYGIWDTERNVFYPLGELPPGLPASFYLARTLGEEYAGVGTGTTAPTNRLRMYANGASCVVCVKAWER